MKKPKKFSTIACPDGKFKKGFPSARECKNNCSKYRRGCQRFP